MDAPSKRLLHNGFMRVRISPGMLWNRLTVGQLALNQRILSSNLSSRTI